MSTSEKELSKLIGQVRNLGATVNVKFDSQGFHSEIQIIGLKGIGSHPVTGMIHAAEMMRAATMSNQITQTKVAWIRNQNTPIDQPAPGYLDCPCGNAPETNYSPETGNVTCTCSRVYTWNGYVIKGAK